MTTFDDRTARRLADIASVTGAVPGDPPVLDGPRDDATPYAWQADDGTLHITVNERGNILSDSATHDLEEFAYRFAEILTTVIAQRTHPLVEPAARQAAWAEQYRLLGLLDPAWASRWREELCGTLHAAGATADLVLLP